MKVDRRLPRRAATSPSRATGAAEYSVRCPVPQGTATDCLPQEISPLVIEDDNEIDFGGLRFDKYFGESSVLTLEGGYADISGPPVPDRHRPRAGDRRQPPVGARQLQPPHWNFLGYWNAPRRRRPAGPAPPAPSSRSTRRTAVEVQSNWEPSTAAGPRGRRHLLPARSRSTPSTPRAFQTLIFEPVDAELHGALRPGRLLDLTDEPQARARRPLRREHAARRAVLAQGVPGLAASTPTTASALTYNEAFQVAELLRVLPAGHAAAPREPGSPFEAICRRAGGVVLGGFAPGPDARVLALRQRSLEVEEITTLRGRLHRHPRRPRLHDPRLLQQREQQLHHRPAAGGGHPLGRINPNFGPTAARGLPAPVRRSSSPACSAGLRAAVRVPDEQPRRHADPRRVAPTPTSARWTPRASTSASTTSARAPGATTFTYSWFDFEIQDQSGSSAIPAAAQLAREQGEPGFRLRGRTLRLSPASAGSTSSAGSSDPSRATSRPTTRRPGGQLQDHPSWRVGVNVANVFDDEHWESFGGDLIGRRVLGHVEYSW